MLSYQITGRGRPLLLLHGWGVTYAVWRQLAPLLARHFQLIIVDFLDTEVIPIASSKQSYYVTCADALEKLRESLDITRWSMLAYSIGTLVGETYLRRYPLRVERAAFICPINARWIWRFLLNVFRWVDRRHPWPSRWVLTGWRLDLVMRFCGFNLERHPAAVEWVREAAMKPTQLLKLLLFDMPDNGRAPYLSATSSHIPTLFIWGKWDVMSALPANQGPHDIYLPLNHAAPVSAPFMIAPAILPFLIAQETVHSRERVTSRASKSAGLDQIARVDHADV